MAASVTRGRARGTSAPVAQHEQDDQHAATANQTSGLVPGADIIVKAAMPVIEPMMSMAYALSGGIDLSSGPSGMASAAMSRPRPATTKGRTRKLVSAALALGEAEEQLVGRPGPRRSSW